METPKPSMRDLLERIANGVEALGVDPEVEIDFGPPLCPSCGMVDPEIVIPPHDGVQGRMGDLYSTCQCKHCGKPIYIVIESYSCHANLETVKNELTERRERGFGRV